MSYEQTLRQDIANALTGAKCYPHKAVGRAMLLDAFYYTATLLDIPIMDLEVMMMPEKPPEPGK